MLDWIIAAVLYLVAASAIGFLLRRADCPIRRP